jgi:hypothetical protein
LSGTPSDFAKASFDSVGGPDGFSLGQEFVAPAGEEVVEIVAQTADGFGIIGGPAVGETACGGPRLWQSLALMMPCKSALTVGSRVNQYGRDRMAH